MLKFEKLRVINYCMGKEEEYVVEVESIEEAVKIKNVLANYRLFLLENEYMSNEYLQSVVQWYDKRDNTWNDVEETFLEIK